MYPAVLESCAVANTSAHWMPLLFFLTLYGAWWALPSVYVVYFCCMDLYYYYKQTKKTQIPHILIFFNKEYSVFPNLQCASCWFPFIVLPLPCPYLPPLHPPSPPTSSPAVTKIDNFHASSITGPEWVYLLSFMVIVLTETLENAVCYSQSRLEPLTHGCKVISCPPGCADDLSSWK